MSIMPGAQERLCELREEAYCKVLKCFVASQSYDLVREPQKLPGTASAVRTSFSGVLQLLSLCSCCASLSQQRRTWTHCAAECIEHYDYMLGCGECGLLVQLSALIIVKCWLAGILTTVYS